MGWLSGYTYRKAVNISGSSSLGTQTNVVKLIIVHNTTGTDSGFDVYVNGLCRSDFHDLRFTLDDQVTLVKHFIFAVNGTTATVVFQMPSVPAAGVTFYMYYGYSSATDASDSTLFTVYESMQNLNGISNGSFEVGSPPTGWAIGGSGSASRDNTHVLYGNYSLKVVFGSSEEFVDFHPLPLAAYGGQQVTFGCWVWCASANTACLDIYDNNGSGYVDYRSSSHPGDSQWHFLSITATLRSGLTDVITRCHAIGTGTAWFDGATFIRGSSGLQATQFAIFGSSSGSTNSAAYDYTNKWVVLNNAGSTQGAFWYTLTDPLSFGMIFEQKMTSGANSELAFGESSDTFPTTNDYTAHGWNWVSDNYSSYTRVTRDGNSQQLGGFDSLADNNFHTIVGLANQNSGTPANRDYSFSAPFDGVSFSGTNVTAPASATQFGWNARSASSGSTHILGKHAIFQAGAVSVSSYGPQQTAPVVGGKSGQPIGAKLLAMGMV
jgi:Domain of unknown function (DUF2341)